MRPVLSPAVDPRETFPLTLRHLGTSGPQAKTPEEFARLVCDAHAKGDIPSRAVRDLVMFEMHLATIDAAPTDPPAAAPRPDEPIVVSPHVRVVMYGADLPGILKTIRAGGRVVPRAAQGWIVIRRRGREVDELVMGPERGWIVERFREPATVEETLGDHEMERFAELWREGILVRAA